MDNNDEKLDEMKALSAIFAQDWISEDMNNYSFSIKLTSKTGMIIRLEFKLPKGYPENEKPIFDVSAPWMSRADKANLVEKLNIFCDQNKGYSVVYQLINLAQEVLDSITQKTEHDSGSDSSNHNQVIDDKKDEIDITIYHGNSLVDRKSVFQAHLAAVNSQEEVQQVLEKLKENRKILAATHNMWAYRISIPESNSYNQNCDDDGETHAGSRMLHLLQILDAKNVLVVVSRWYGGIQLGPDRFKHINNVMRELLDQHNYIKK